MGKVQKKIKKTNNSTFSATHTYIKLTLVSFFPFFSMHLSLNQTTRCSFWLTSTRIWKCGEEELAKDWVLTRGNKVREDFHRWLLPRELSFEHPPQNNVPIMLQCTWLNSYEIALILNFFFWIRIRLKKMQQAWMLNLTFGLQSSDLIGGRLIWGW